MRSRRRWTRPASRPRTSPATRWAATSPCSSPPAAGRGRSSPSRRPAPRDPVHRHDHEHIPGEIVAHLIAAAAACVGAAALIEHALRAGYRVEPERIACPVRIVWGTADRLLPWPSAAARYREDWLPQADWVQLEGVGHCPQLDVPLETAQLILGFTAP